jgi:hypothetical protein
MPMLAPVTSAVLPLSCKSMESSGNNGRDIEASAAGRSIGQA